MKSSNSKPNMRTDNCVFINGEWWYNGRADGRLRRIKSEEKNREKRMFVEGKYISKKDPRFVKGSYDSWEDVESLKKIKEAVVVDPRLLKIREEDKANYAESDNKYSKLKPGYVYVITNPAWPEDCKVGHSRQPDKRLSSFNTGSPNKDYKLEGSEHFEDRAVVEKYIHNLLEKEGIERKEGEWFVCSPEYILDKLKNLTPEYKVGMILQDDIEVEHETGDSGYRNRRTALYESVDGGDDGPEDRRGTQLSLSV